MFKNNYIFLCEALICLAFWCCPQFAKAQEKIVFTVRSCATNEGLNNAYIFNENNIPVGISNEDGRIYPDTQNQLQKIRISKFGYRDTVITFTQKKQSEVCLFAKEFKLPEVEISAVKVSVHEQLEAYIKASSKNLLLQTDTLYYKYDYSVYVPERNWSERMTGILKLPLRSYDKGYGGEANIIFCSIEFQVDSVFWNSPRKESFNDNQLFGLLSFDNFRKGRLFQKRIKSKWNITKQYDKSNTSFKIEDKDKNTHYIDCIVSFDEDSLVNYFEHIWEAPDNDGFRMLNSRNTTLKAYEVYRSYRKEFPIVFDYLNGKMHCHSKNEIDIIVNLELELLSNEEVSHSQTCENHNFFIEFTPAYFRKNNIKVTYF